MIENSIGLKLCRNPQCEKFVDPDRRPQAFYCIDCALLRQTDWNGYVADWRGKNYQQYRHQNNLHARKSRKRKKKATEDGFTTSCLAIPPILLIAFYGHDWVLDFVLLAFKAVVPALITAVSTYLLKKKTKAQKKKQKQLD